jgi:hypothetical protein
VVTMRDAAQPIWQEERLRYEVLRFVYDHAGASCMHEVTGSQIGAALQLNYEELYRIVHFLENRGYLRYLGAGPRVCLSDDGIRYLEELAVRRRTVRG